MANIYDMTDTWNDAGTVFSAIKTNVTDTASNAASLLIDLQVGGASRFRVNKAGGIIAGTGHNPVLLAPGAGVSGRVSISGGVGTIGLPAGAGQGLNLGTLPLEWATTPFNTRDLSLNRDAANVLAQRNGTNAQTFNIYNTYTDASNYERGFMRWNSDVLEIGAEAAGTGTVRALHISGLPTANPGAGILWNDAGTVKVGT